jgi:hypothetical protein
VTIRAGLHEQDRGPRPAQHGFRHGPSDRPVETASAVRAHHDEVHVPHTRSVHDRLGGASVPHGSDDPGDALVAESSGNGGEIRLGLAHDGRLSATAFGKAISAKGEPSSGTNTRSTVIDPPRRTIRSFALNA